MKKLFYALSSASLLLLPACTKDFSCKPKEDAVVVEEVAIVEAPVADAAVADDMPAQ